MCKCNEGIMDIRERLYDLTKEVCRVLNKMDSIEDKLIKKAADPILVKILKTD
jgi:hypothetical protein